MAEASKRDHFEFGGRLGVLGITLAVPFFSYVFNIFINDEPVVPVKDLFQYSIEQLPQVFTPTYLLSLFDPDAFLMYFGWYAWTVLCWFVVPGKTIQGVALRNGQRLNYKINAFGTLCATVAVLGSTFAIYGPEPFVYIYDHAAGLVTAALTMSIAQACFVYLQSFQSGILLAEGGDTSSGFYNWFIGRSLNPRIGEFDIKSFNELRPGLILWLIIDLAMAAKQYTDFGTVSIPMLIVVGSHANYIIDSLYNEELIFSTMDITTDGFGFMLSVGDLLWVPFTYSLQARYLATRPFELSKPFLAFVVIVNLLGYYIFRYSNAEKDAFRKGHNPKNLKSLETKRGTKLLIEGWWGMSRHPNYLGDWIMAWAWCLPTSFETPFTYFYVIYFAILLIHRAARDDAACRVKYGDDWNTYCNIVKWKIVPYVY